MFMFASSCVIFIYQVLCVIEKLELFHFNSAESMYMTKRLVLSSLSSIANLKVHATFKHKTFLLHLCK